MGIFSGEEYSKKRFDEAKEILDVVKTEAEIRRTYGMRGVSAEEKQRIYDEIWSNESEARERVEKLYGKGHAEARALNEEYDRLRTRAQEAIKAIADFEREKLGMHEEKEKSDTK